MKAPDHIIRDLMRKCGDDVAAAVMLSARLVSDTGDSGAIATGGAGKALGIATGFFMASCTEAVSPEEAAEALWAKLRPLVIAAAAECAASETAPSDPGQRLANP